jgi:hypothetical protein
LLALDPKVPPLQGSRAQKGHFALRVDGATFWHLHNTLPTLLLRHRAHVNQSVDILCDDFAVYSAHYVANMSLIKSAIVRLNLTPGVGVEARPACDVISVVAEFMADVVGVEARPARDPFAMQASPVSIFLTIGIVLCMSHTEDNCLCFSSTRMGTRWK